MCLTPSTIFASLALTLITLMATATLASSSTTSSIAMAHGAGGEATRRLVEGLFQPAFSQSVARFACPMPPSFDAPAGPAWR